MNLRYISNTIEIQMYASFPKEFISPKILRIRLFSPIYNLKVLIKIKDIFPEAKICLVGTKKDDSYAKTLQFVKKIMLKLFLLVNYQNKNGLSYQKIIMYL